MKRAAPMADYKLRRVDASLWRRVKTRAAGEGRTIRFVICELLRIYADHGYGVVETFDRHERKK